MDVHERAAVSRRIEQIRLELTYPKATASQVAALQRELHSLERSWQSEQSDGREFIAQLTPQTEAPGLERSQPRTLVLPVESPAPIESANVGTSLQRGKTARSRAETSRSGAGRG
jgi:hypothetical protein